MKNKYCYISVPFQAYCPFKIVVALFLSVILLLCLPNQIQAQAVQSNGFLYETKNFLVDPTLSDNQINSLVQDQQGFIWVATKKGIARFNGYQFDVFNSGDSIIQLPLGNIPKLEISGDELYVATVKGLVLVNTISFKTQQIKQDPSAGFAVLDIVKHQKGAIYWYSNDGFLNKKEGDQIQRYQLPFSYKAVNLSLQLHQSNIYLFDLSQGILCVDAKTLQLKHRYQLPSEVIDNKICIDGQGRLLFMTGTQVYTIDSAQNKLKAFTELGNQISDVLTVNKDQFIIKNYNQIWHHQKGDAFNYTQQLNTKIYRPVRIYKLYQINQQILATSTEGLIILQYKPKRFSTVYQTYNKRNNSFDVPRGIVEDSAHIYFGTYYSLGIYHKKTQTLQNATKEPLSIHWTLKEADTIWLATEGNGLMKYLTKTKESIRLQPNYDGKKIYLKCLAKWGKDSFLLGGYAYLFLYDRSKQRFTKQDLVFNGSILKDLEVNQIINLPNKSFLLATNKGVFRVNQSWQITQHYRSNKDTVYKDIDYANAIYLSPKQQLWVGTSNGVLQFELTGKLLKHFTRSEGLAGNKIASLVADKNQHLWVSTFTGLSVIYKNSHQIFNYFIEDGLPDNEFNRSSFLLASNGNLFLGTVMGFIQFSPTQFELLPYKKRSLSISKIIYGTEGKEFAEYSPEKVGSGSIRLGKEIRYIKISFFSNAVELQKNPLYEFKVEGIHSNWVSMGNTPVLHLDNVKTGEYILKVRMISGYGSEGILEASFPLVVQQYFYTTPWFYIIMIGALFALIIGYIRLLLAREKRMRDIRRDISQDLHDEIGSYLTGISMNIDLLQKNKDKSNQYIQTIQLLGKKSLLALKDGLWSLDPNSDTAEQLWDRIKSITKETLEPLDIAYQFGEAPGLKLVRLTMLEKRNILFAIKECITNSFKYGDGYLIEFNWQNNKGEHTITIKNKIGAPKEKLAGGQGLIHIKNRMKRIQGDASFCSDTVDFTVTLNLLFLHDTIRHYRRQ